jgi:hypothetical protein
VKRIVVAVLVAFVATMLVLAAQVPEGTEVLTFEHKLGNVTFQHAMHAGLEGVECQTCHHTSEAGETPEKCSACHLSKPPEGEEAPKLFKAVHDQCWGCHQEKVDAGMDSGPLKGAKNCKECHVRG